MRAAALVLAAGLSRRAAQPKLLAERAGVPLLHHALQPLFELGLETIVVVSSAASQVQRVLAPRPGLQLVVNPQPERGLSSSLQCGAALLRHSPDPFFVVLADMPRVSVDTYRALLAALQAGDLAAVPVHAGRRGNPVLLSPRALAPIDALAGDQGLRQVLLAERDGVREVPVADDGIALDLDDAAAIAAWQRSGA